MQTASDYLDDEPGEYRRQCEMIREEKAQAKRAKELDDQWEAAERAAGRLPREELTAEGVQYALPGIAKADNGGLF